MFPQRTIALLAVMATLHPLPGGGVFHAVRANPGGGPGAPASAQSPSQDSTSPPDRLALLVGISDYPPANMWPRLPGAVRDATSIRRVLTGRFGFEEANARLLLDEQATRQAILDAFDEMIERAGPDTVVVFFFAGHGSQVRDRSSDEDDGLDETLVPWDSIHKRDARNDVLDDELGERFDRLATPHVVGLFDCCHSGTAMRGGDDLISRHVPPEGGGPGSRGRGRPTASVPRRELVAVDLRARRRQPVILTACEDHQEARESQELGRGWFSLALERALIQIQPDATWREVHTRVRHELRSQTTSQDPVLHGTGDAVVFDSRFDAVARRFSVARVEHGRVVVEAGQAQGVLAGSRLLLRPYGEPDPGPTIARDHATRPRLEVLVEESGFSTCWSRPTRAWTLAEKKAVTDRAHYAEFLEGPVPDFELTMSLAPEFSDSIHDSFRTLSGATLLRPPVPGDLVISMGEVGFEVFHDGVRVIPHPLRMHRGSPELRHDPALLLDDLRAYATWNAVRRIQNPGSPLYDLVEVHVECGRGWQKEHRPPGGPVFEADDDLWRRGPLDEWQVDMRDVDRLREQHGDPHLEPYLRLVIQSHHDQPLHFAVVDLRPDWAVTPLGRTARKLAPYQAIALPLRVIEDDTLVVGVAPERIKLLFTDRRENFWLQKCDGIRPPEQLERPAYTARAATRGPGDGAVGRVAWLLDHLRGDRTMRGPSDDAEPYLWTCKEVDFSVLPRER